jgi:hypothetical protein
MPFTFHTGASLNDVTYKKILVLKHAGCPNQNGKCD